MLDCALCVRKERLMLPVSWYTVPPPLFRLARAIPRSLNTGTAASVQGFWCLPTTTQGEFR